MAMRGNGQSKMPRTRSRSASGSKTTVGGLVDEPPAHRQASKSCGSVTMLALEDEEWYHGLLPREDITKMLTKQGDWLVRRSEVKGESKHVLSVFWAGKANHVVLHKSADGKRHLISAEKDFGTIQELVGFYKSSCQPLPAMPYILQNAIHRQEWELRHEWIKCEKKIGEGAFGEVFKGTLRCGNGDSLPVAIKRSHATKEMSKAEIVEIVAESRIMQKFKHPNLVRLWGVAAETQPIMLVLELVTGGGLDGYLKKNKCSAYMKVKFCLDASKGCEYLHKMGCIHRDLACRNCLISDAKVVKISDFGLSQEGTSYTMKATDKVPIRWLAPETMMPESYGKYTMRTDIWSFAIMMWEILHDGIEPYPGMRVPEVAREVKSGYRIPVDSDSLVPFPVRSILTAAWLTEPAERPTMADMRIKLEQALKEMPVEQ